MFSPTYIFVYHLHRAEGLQRWSVKSEAQVDMQDQASGYGGLNRIDKGQTSEG